MIIPLAVIALVLPNFTTSTAGGTLSLLQAIFFSVFTIGLYGIFLWLQTGRHRGFFTAGDAVAADAIGRPLPHQDTGLATVSIPVRICLLLANILPIVILAKSLAKLLDHGIAAIRAPTALGGIVIVMIVFTPEGISAMKAVAANQLTRAINLCLGAATSTLGLTVPAVLTIGLITGQSVVLGVSAANMVLLTVTLILSTLTFSGTRTTMKSPEPHAPIAPAISWRTFQSIWRGVALASRPWTIRAIVRFPKPAFDDQ